MEKDRKHTWRPSLKDNKRRSATRTDTERLAGEALSTMRSIEKIRTKGGDIRGAAMSITTRSTPRDKPKNKASMKKRAATLCAAAVLAAAVLAAAAALSIPPTSHHVAGSVRMGPTPLRTEVRFHPDEGEPLLASADEHGRFEAKAIGAGRYRITLHPGNGDIPEEYADPDSTPLVVTIARDVECMSIQVNRGYRKPS